MGDFFYTIISIDARGVKYEGGHNIRDRAIAEAKHHWNNGAFSVRVFHNENGERIDDYARKDSFSREEA